jgi:hypothetical protein
MANDDIEFVDNSILLAYIYMETHSNCGGGCFYQDRNGRDWHVEGMQAVQAKKIIINNIPHYSSPKRVHVHYAQVGIFPKWLGDLVGWWCDEQEYGHYLRNEDYRRVSDKRIGLHTYGGDNELSARIIDLGFAVEPISPTKPLAKITDKEAKDELREINNIDGGHDPKAVQGHHPDSWKFGQKWLRRNNAFGISGHYPGPILKDKPMVQNPLPSAMKERVLYLPLFEQEWQVLKEQKRGLRDALAKIALVQEYDYMEKYNQLGKVGMINELHKICQEFKPTIFLSQLHNADQLNSGDIISLYQTCGNTTRFVNWNGDYWPEQLLRQDGLDLARSFDLMTSVNRDVIEKHQAQGINTQYWQIGWEPLGRGYAPEIYHDIVFLASAYSEKRKKLGKFLHDQPFSIGLYGNGWPDGLSKGENLYNFIEACKIYRGSKIAIGNNDFPESGWVSNRIFQILAAGNTVLCHQWFRGYEELGLVDKENCLIWKDLDELGQILKYWLSDTRSQKLAEIAANGEKLALERHSFDSRVSELWEMLGINQAQGESWRW